MNTYQSFIFEGYDFDRDSKTLKLNYGLDKKVNFSETYRFDFDFIPNIDQRLLDFAISSLFYMAGVSYYKAYLPPKIELNKTALLDNWGAEFFSKTYQKGLGEFFYVNGLDPTSVVNFVPNSTSLPTIKSEQHEGLLVAVGGGKDSLLSTELLRSQAKVATWSVGHRSQLEPLVKKIGLPHFWVDREWDKSLLEHNSNGALNGHIPISAIISCVGLVVAILTGYKDIVMSNESSANEPTLHYQNTDINHQYSKSIEFEKDFKDYLTHRIDGTFRYYSLLRPFTEVRIADMFSKIGFEKYKAVFSSCNRAFVHSSNSMFWCGECPKCAFVFLAFTPFIPRQELETLFSGKNLLLDPLLEPTYRQLLGIEGDKPLECVGEIKESRSAMRLAQAIYPELNKYKFEIPDNYDFRAKSPHLIPEDIVKLLASRSLL